MSKENNRNEIKKKLMDNNEIPSDLKEEFFKRHTFLCVLI